MNTMSIPIVDSDNLARLALGAATEIDRIQRGRGGNPIVIKDFADALERFSPPAGAEGENAFYLAPSQTELLGRAVSTTSAQKVSDLNELAKELKRVTAEMRTLEQTDGNRAPMLAALKSFCLVLNDFVTTSRGATSLYEYGVFDYDHTFVG